MPEPKAKPDRSVLKIAGKSTVEGNDADKDADEADDDDDDAAVEEDADKDDDADADADVDDAGNADVEDDDVEMGNEQKARKPKKIANRQQFDDSLSMRDYLKASPSNNVTLYGVDVKCHSTILSKYALCGSAFESSRGTVRVDWPGIPILNVGQAADDAAVHKYSAVMLIHRSPRTPRNYCFQHVGYHLVNATMSHLLELFHHYPFIRTTTIASVPVHSRLYNCVDIASDWAHSAYTEPKTIDDLNNSELFADDLDCINESWKNDKHRRIASRTSVAVMVRDYIPAVFKSSSHSLVQVPLLSEMFQYSHLQTADYYVATLGANEATRNQASRQQAFDDAAAAAVTAASAATSAAKRSTTKEAKQQAKQQSKDAKGAKDAAKDALDEALKETAEATAKVTAMESKDFNQKDRTEVRSSGEMVRAIMDRLPMTVHPALNINTIACQSTGLRFNRGCLESLVTVTEGEYVFHIISPHDVHLVYRAVFDLATREHRHNLATPSSKKVSERREQNVNQHDTVR